MKITLRTIAILLPLAMLLAACGKKYDQKGIENKVAKDWRGCEIVVPEKIRIESTNGKTVRYSYTLRLVADLDARGYQCYEPHMKMLEALTNKTRYQLKAGTEIPVTQEVTDK